MKKYRAELYKRVNERNFKGEKKPDELIKTWTSDSVNNLTKAIRRAYRDDCIIWLDHYLKYYENGFEVDYLWG